MLGFYYNSNYFCKPLLFTNSFLNFSFSIIYFFYIEEKPEFVKAPEAQMKASEGQNTNLSCQTAGQPKPQVLWYKDGKQITGGRYRTLSNGDLYIQVGTIYY